MTRFGNEPLLRALTHTLGEGSTLYGSHPKRHLGGTPVLLMNRMNNSTHALFDLIMSMNSAVHRLFMSMPLAHAVRCARFGSSSLSAWQRRYLRGTWARSRLSTRPRGQGCCDVTYTTTLTASTARAADVCAAAAAAEGARSGGAAAGAAAAVVAAPAVGAPAAARPAVALAAARAAVKLSGVHAWRPAGRPSRLGRLLGMLPQL